MSREPLSFDETLVCVATTTPRTDAGNNEDAAETACAPRAQVRGVVVADGLGSYTEAGPAARHAAHGAARWLREEAEHFGGGTLVRLFARVHGDLRAHARRAAGGKEPAPQSFGTTLLVGVDTGMELVAAYAGNGAAWHIRGNVDDFSGGAPWNAVNLLNPHSLLRDGREVLYNLVDAAAPSPPVPTVVSVRKDTEFGDILLLCTDGVYSADQVTVGTDAEGRAWISAEETMAAFHRALRELFAGWDGHSELPLRAALDAWLEGLRSRGMLEDDATVGVIVTADALRYQRRRAGERAAADRDGADEPGTEKSPRGWRMEDAALNGGEGAGETATTIGEGAECTSSPLPAA